VSQLKTIGLADLDGAVGGLDWSAVGREAGKTALGFGAIGAGGGAVTGGIVGGLPGAGIGAGIGAAGGAAWGGLVGAGREVSRQMGWQKKGVMQ